MRDELFEQMVCCLNTVRQMKADNIELLKKSIHYKKLRKNEFLCREGEIQDMNSFVCRGLFRYYYIDLDGNEHTKHFTCENDFAVSFSSFIYQIPSAYYIEALEDSELLCIDYPTYNSRLQDDLVWQIIARKYTERIYFIKEQREASFLLCDAKQRYRLFLEQFANLEKRLKQKHIASYLGITSECLSRIRNIQS